MLGTRKEACSLGLRAFLALAGQEDQITHEPFILHAELRVKVNLDQWREFHLSPSSAKLASFLHCARQLCARIVLLSLFFNNLSAQLRMAAPRKPARPLLFGSIPHLAANP